VSAGRPYDLIVLGAGAAGMTAALTGALEGLRVIVIEKTGQIGGTTSRSSGSVWIPGNDQQAALGITGDAERAMQYLDALVGDRAPRALRLAYVREAPRMLSDLARRADLHFRVYPHAPDYRPDLPGALAGGRALEPLPFDGRTLGSDFARVRPTLPEFTVFGGMMVTRAEVAQLLRLPLSWRAWLLAFVLALRYGFDRLHFPRGTRLVLGNALAATLYARLIARAVPVRFETNVSSVARDDGGALGGVVVRDSRGEEERIVGRAIVFAGGGFPASATLRARFLPEPVATQTPAFEGCTGDTLELGLSAGGVLGAPGGGNALWFPSSVMRRPDGSTAVFPHIVLDRGKPGLIAVNAEGARFVDEAAPYHEFVRAMYASHARAPTIPAWLICDRRFLWRYGLGLVRPHTLRLRRFIAAGYLHRGVTLAELAGTIGVAARGLCESVARNNAAAARGTDEEFGKGGNVYDRSNGNPRHRPNPCLGPIARAPFYGVAVVPTPLGTSLGLRTDERARVLDADGEVVPGLYACGNDMNAPLGGEYPGAGAQLGTALTFGYLAALDVAAAGLQRATTLASRS